MAKYQLVLQTTTTGSMAEFDELIELEAALESGLDPVHDVTGHDSGSGEMNIFIHTDDPQSAFGAVRRIVSEAKLDRIRAAFRDEDGDDFTILWPEGWPGPFVVT